MPENLKKSGHPNIECRLVYGRWRSRAVGCPTVELLRLQVLRLLVLPVEASPVAQMCKLVFAV